MPDNADKEEAAERDRQQVRPKSPGLAREPDPDEAGAEGEGEDFLPAD